MLPQYLIYITSFAASLGTLYYAYETFRGRVRPNKVSWFMWSFSIFLGQMIALREGVSFYDTIPLFVAWLTNFIVFIISFVNKDASWEIRKKDFIFLILSFISLVIWLFLQSPFLALLLIIVSDIFSGLPTLIKSYKYPETESLSSYLPGFVNTSVGILILTDINFYNSAFLIWLTVSNFLKIIPIGIYQLKFFKSLK